MALKTFGVILDTTYWYTILSVGWLISGGCHETVIHVALFSGTVKECGWEVTPLTGLSSVEQTDI